MFHEQMEFIIFHTTPNRVVKVNCVERSEYGHAMGGSAAYEGLTPIPDSPPIHLLFRLNQDDPVLGQVVSGVQWLPLLCGIHYHACNLGYHVVSNNEVKILHIETPDIHRDSHDDFPDVLPFVESIALRTTNYDPNNIEHALLCARVFEFEGMDPERFQELIRHVEEEDSEQLERFETSAEEALRNIVCSPFMQGRPDDDCPDPACSNHGRKGTLRTLAIFTESWMRDYDRLWLGRGNPQIVYQICPDCCAIRVTSQSD